MVHLVAGFPSPEGFAEAARALADGGAEILEIQIPFSDPTADGPAITQASAAAIRNGFQTADIFNYIRAAQAAGFKRIMVMTYANIAFRYGIAKYVKDMQAAGVEGLIIPDLPLEDEEGFYQTARQNNIAPVPVAVAGMPADRIALLKPYKKVYVSLRSGITGSETVISEELKQFLQKLNKTYELYGGFGISTASQIQALAPLVYATVIGSYFTRTIQKAVDEKQGIYSSVSASLKSLTVC